MRNMCWGVHRFHPPTPPGRTVPPGKSRSSHASSPIPFSSRSIDFLYPRVPVMSRWFPPLCVFSYRKNPVWRIKVWEIWNLSILFCRSWPSRTLLVTGRNKASNTGISETCSGMIFMSNSAQYRIHYCWKMMEAEHTLSHPWLSRKWAGETTPTLHYI